MQLVTKEYLLEIIQRKASSTIRVYRKRFPHSMNLSIYPVATMEEVKEFVACIPYFDQSLKDFLLSSKEEQTIISQPWENAFVANCEYWLNSDEWKYGKPNFQHLNNANAAKSKLALPF